MAVAYNDVDAGLDLAGATGLQTSALNYLEAHNSKKDLEVKDGATNVTFWNAMANVTLQKNVQLHAEYAFDVDAENYNGEDDSWTVSLNYKF